MRAATNAAAETAENSNPWGLSPRQGAMLEATVTALSQKDAARHMGISEFTARAYLQEARLRMGMTTVQAVVAWEKHRANQGHQAVQKALQTLLSVCRGMDLEDQLRRPSEAEYQAALAAAEGALQACTAQPNGKP